MSNEGQGGATMKIRWGKFPPQDWATIENNKREEYVGHFYGYYVTLQTCCNHQC